MVPQPEWLGPVLAVTLRAIGLTLLALGLGLFRYTAFHDIKDRIAGDRAKAAPSAPGPGYPQGAGRHGRQNRLGRPDRFLCRAPVSAKQRR